MQLLFQREHNRCIVAMRFRYQRDFKLIDLNKKEAMNMAMQTLAFKRCRMKASICLFKVRGIQEEFNIRQRIIHNHKEQRLSLGTKEHHPQILMPKASSV